MKHNTLKTDINKATIIFLIFSFFVLSGAEAEEKSFNGLLGDAVKQIKGVEPQEAKEKTPGGNKDGVKTGSIFIYGVSGSGGKVGQTFYKSDGSYQIMIDESDVDSDLGVIKMVLFHEFEHVRLMNGSFGFKDPITGKPVGPVITEGGLIPGEEDWNTDIAHCHEAIAHANSLIYAQSKSGEFPNLNKSKLFWHSIDLFEGYAEKCKRVKFKGKWEDVGKNLKGELEKLKGKIAEKKLLKAKRDGKISKSDIKQIKNICGWLGLSDEEFEDIYKSAVIGDLEKGAENFTASLPPEISGLMQNERILLVVESENIKGRELFSKGFEIKNGEISMKEPQDAAVIMRVDEAFVNSIFNSLDPVYAAGVALKEGDIKIERGLITPFVSFVQRIFGPDLLHKDAVEYRGENASFRTNAKGVTFIEIEGEKEVVMLNKYLSPAGYSTSGAQKLMDYRPEELSKNAGIYAEDLEELGFGEL